MSESKEEKRRFVMYTGKQGRILLELVVYKEMQGKAWTQEKEDRYREKLEAELPNRCYRIG